MKMITVATLSLALACGGSEKSAEEPKGDGDERIEIGERSGSRRSTAPQIDDDDDSDPNLNVKGLRGRISLDDVKDAFRPKMGAMLACFSPISKKNKWIGGGVKFAFVIGETGSVSQVAIMESDLGAWQVEECVLGVARAMTFVKPKGGASAEFTQPLEFPSRKKPLEWTEDQTDQEVADKLSTLAECEQAPKDVWITLYVGRLGKVLSSGFASPDKKPLDPGWASCAAGILGEWVLTDPRGRPVKTFFRYSP